MTPSKLKSVLTLKESSSLLVPQLDTLLNQSASAEDKSKNKGSSEQNISNKQNNQKSKESNSAKSINEKNISRTSITTTDEESLADFDSPYKTISSEVIEDCLHDVEPGFAHTRPSAKIVHSSMSEITCESFKAESEVLQSTEKSKLSNMDRSFSMKATVIVGGNAVKSASMKSSSVKLPTSPLNQRPPLNSVDNGSQIISTSSSLRKLFPIILSEEELAELAGR
jgi:hypothetical protein